MKNVSTIFRIALGGVLFSVALLLSGCKTTEPENASSRPWGYRGGYDYGLPAMMNEGR